MIYIKPLSEYKFNLKSKKLEGLARLTKLKLPTVSNLFIVHPQLYQEFLNTKKLPPVAQQELKIIFNSIRKQGHAITLRNSIYESGNPGIAFCVHNSLNLKSFSEFEKRIILGYKKTIRTAINPQRVEFCFLIQSFYSSEKCGIVLSDNGQGEIFLQAILGQHTNLLLRGDIKPDAYNIHKKLIKSLLKTLPQKNFVFENLLQE